jgi:Uma2 family endonuclease
MSDVAAPRSPPMTVEAFLDFCETLPDGERWELHDGRPVMMVGGTAAHAIIGGNILSALSGPARKRGCRALSGFLVRASEASLFEPDVAIFCGQLDPKSRFSREPRAVFEVLSPSTMRHDRVLKFERYRSMPSIDQIVHVFQENMRVESWLRGDEAWLDEPVIVTSPEALLSVACIGTSIALADIYDGLEYLSG